MKQPLNILLTSAGRRGSLVNIFRKALTDRELEGKVYAVDIHPELSAACAMADESFRAPRITESTYVPFLVELCQAKNISILVPTIDTELVELAAMQSQFQDQNVLLAISSQNICQTFARKKSTFEWFSLHGIDTPTIVTDLEKATFPLFAKHDDSSCSIGAEKVATLERAKALMEANENYIFQEYISGTEYTVDVYIDRRGQLIDIVPRQRLEVRAGEVSKGLAVRDADIIAAVKIMTDKLQGAFGVLTVQVFKTARRIVFIEVNPRLGGGFPLSVAAGADMAGYLIKDFLREPLQWQDTWKNNTLMLRYDAEVIRHGFSI